MNSKIRLLFILLIKGASIYYIALKLVFSTMDSDDPFAIFQLPIKRMRPESIEEHGPRKLIHEDTLNKPEILIPP